MAFKDHNCTCDEQCRCDHSTGEGRPCKCESMADDPHCEICLGHLTLGQERAWREDMEKRGIDLSTWRENWENLPL